MKCLPLVIVQNEIDCGYNSWLHRRVFCVKSTKINVRTMILSYLVFLHFMLH